ncbi:MAG TPA: galactokinase [Cytophagales bacterium]|nr:galactokinase [Cytophagales bacterium]
MTNPGVETFFAEDRSAISKEAILSVFKEKYQGFPLPVRSPGRVNLIGEHTDYNEGFVLPAAIDKETRVVMSLREDNDINIYSIDLDDNYKGKIDDLKRSEKGWPNYILGVADQLIKAGHQIKGFNCVFGGNIPIGAGLSSSAALECATIFGLNELNHLKIEKVRLVKFAQAAENHFVGVQCGIMDQFISMFGRKNQVFKLDCRDLSYEYFPFMTEGIKIVLLDTQVKHSLNSSEYNTRRQQCEAGVNMLKKYNSSIYSLRDVSLPLLKEHREEMDPIVYKRCEYVLEENERLLRGCESLKDGDLKAFGQKMYESHEGLSRKYEVSCPELDFLVEFSKKESAVLGARMMGGGFGGCTINIVKEQDLEAFIEKAAKEYKKATGIDLKAYAAVIEDGTSVVD